MKISTPVIKTSGFFGEKRY